MAGLAILWGVGQANGGWDGWEVTRAISGS